MAQEYYSFMLNRFFETLVILLMLSIQYTFIVLRPNLVKIRERNQICLGYNVVLVTEIYAVLQIVTIEFANMVQS